CLTICPYTRLFRSDARVELVRLDRHVAHGVDVTVAARREQAEAVAGTGRPPHARVPQRERELPGDHACHARPGRSRPRAGGPGWRRPTRGTIRPAGDAVHDPETPSTFTRPHDPRRPPGRGPERRPPRAPPARPTVPPPRRAGPDHDPTAPRTREGAAAETGPRAPGPGEPGTRAPGSGPVTVAIERRVAPENVPAVTPWVQAGVNRANHYPGFLGSGWDRASAGAHDRHML